MPSWMNSNRDDKNIADHPRGIIQSSMDLTFLYQSGVIVTLLVLFYTLWHFEDVTEQERWKLGFIFLFGLFIWPALLYGLIAINLQRRSDR